MDDFIHDFTDHAFEKRTSGEVAGPVVPEILEFVFLSVWEEIAFESFVSGAIVHFSFEVVCEV